MPRIVQGIRACMVSPSAKSSHLSLISAAEDFAPPAHKMLALTKAVLPTVANEIKAIQLRNCANQLLNALDDLKTCLSRTGQICGSFEAEAMQEAIRNLDAELAELLNHSRTLAGSELKPLPGETLSRCEAQLATHSKQVGVSMAQMISAAAQANEVHTGLAAKETLLALRAFASTIRAITACSVAADQHDDDDQSTGYHRKLIECARVVLEQSCVLVHESKLAVEANCSGNESNTQARLAQIARHIVHSLHECVNCLPGQKDMDDVIKNVADLASALFASPVEFPSGSTRALAHVQHDLSQSALSLNAATNQIVMDACRSAQAATRASHRCSDSFGRLLQQALILAGGGGERSGEEKEAIVRALRDVYASVAKLLLHAKAACSGGAAGEHRQQLSAVVKQCTEHINSVVSACLLSESSTAAAAQRECDNALRAIETTRTIVSGGAGGGDEQVISEPPMTTMSQLTSYYDCLELIIGNLVKFCIHACFC